MRSCDQRVILAR